jgi:uncharacterized protein (DUF608 family)
MGDKPAVDRYSNNLAKAQKAVERLWNGQYYVTSEEGKYREATMSDALFGILLAHKAGLTGLLPVDKLTSHLHHVYENNVRSYEGGRYGALLVAEPGIHRYERDGGDEMQVNEVLTGSAWVLAACLLAFGLPGEGTELAVVLRDFIYSGSGLQFRTPAAWDSRGRYRAPMNMRSLSVWLL